MNVLFSTDLSEPSSTVRTVKEMVRRMDATLLVLHVVAPAPTAATSPLDPAVGLSGTDPYAVYEPTLQQNIERAEEHAFHRFLTRHFDQPVQAALRRGDPAQVILEDADKHDIDLLVLAKRHRGMLERLLLGSVTKQVLKKSVRPVLLIPVLEEDEA